MKNRLARKLDKMAENLVQTGRLITVFGGSGFVGRHVVRALARDGWRVRVACRRPDLAFHLQPLGRVGQIHAVQANLRYPDLVAAALRGAQAAVNLVGILAESGKQTFSAVQGEGTGVVAEAVRAAGVESFVHLSAIGADKNSRSAYARAKGEGEELVRQTTPRAAIVRPSVVFGPEDHFFNRFARMARIMPVLPLIGGGHTKLQPVFVGDVAESVARLVNGAGAAGATYELGGPSVKTMREIYEYVLAVIERKRLLASLPFGLAKIVGFGSEIAVKAALGLFPEDFAITRDQVELLKRDNVVSPQAVAEGRTLAGLGIAAELVEALVPSYLYRFRKTGQFADQRLV